MLHYVDLVLRGASMVILILLIHQRFFSVGGSPRHVIVGKIAMWAGIVITICITIRGANNEHFSISYIVHLLAGFPFLIYLFLTVRLGYKAKKDPSFAPRHKTVANITLLLLILTLLMGVVSVMSH